MAVGLEAKMSSAASDSRDQREEWRVKTWAPPWPWKLQGSRPYNAWVAGVLADGEQILAAARGGDVDAMARALRAERGQFALIAEGERYVIAAADRVTSFPVFLREADGGVEVSADSSVWLRPDSRSDFDEEQARLFLMAGYCIGRGTLLKSVTRLLPGEIAIIDKATGKVSRQRHYRFEPTFDGVGDEAKWRERLDGALDQAIARFLEGTQGRRIWLGLSAGYDSRTLLGKLLQHGAKEIETFSYGTPGNMESRVARGLAQSVGVPWRFVATSGAADRRDFRHGGCTRYRLQGGGLHTIAAVTEFFALQKLVEAGELTGDDVVTNGQTGDFLTGGHIPKNTPFTFEAVDRYILKKHLSLFTDMSEAFGEAGASRLMQGWREAHLSGRGLEGELAVVSAYQSFEWQERQSRFILNQHRAHDYLGLAWRTPLWDADLMELYEKVPLALQRDQKLYLGYLKAWNYSGLFDRMRLPYEPWPRGGALIRTSARAAGLIGGARAKETVYAKLAYFGEYHYLYRLLGPRAFMAFEGTMRSPASLFALDHLARVREALGLAPICPHEKRFAELSGRGPGNVQLASAAVA